MTKINDLLKFDAISEMERLAGKTHNDFNEEEKLTMLSMFTYGNKLKEKALKEINDTYFSMTWVEFKNLMKWNNFKIGYTYTFEYDKTDREAILYYNHEGIVIWATSYYESLNSAKLYAQISYDGIVEFETKVNSFWNTSYESLVMTEELQQAYKSLNSFSHDAFMYIKDGLHISLDCREGVLYKLNEVRKHFKFNKVWTKSPFLWFLDYSEEKGNYDYVAITKKKILNSSPELQKIVNVYMNEN